MSYQSSSLFNNRSFGLFNTPLKPYPTILPQVFRFRHNRLLVSRKSRSRSSCLRLPIAAQSSSSSDIVLIATTKHRDGSLVFRFGDASEVVEKEEIVKKDEVVETEEIVKKDEVVEETESRVEGESNIVKVLDGDQVEVIVKTIDIGYGSGSGRLTEVGDEIRNTDIVGDVAENETNGAIDLRDYQAESSQGFSDIFLEEVFLSESDTEMSNPLEGVESSDNTKFTAELDGDESSDPTMFRLDDSPNIDSSENSERTLLTDGDDETEDPTVSLKLESSQVSQIEVMDDEQPCANGVLDKVEIEDASESDTIDLGSPVSMDVSDVELTEAANEVVEEKLQDTIIEATLIDDIVPSNSLTVELADDENEVVEEQPQDMNINKVTFIDDVSPSDPSDVELTEAVNEVLEEELQDMNITEAALINEMPPSDPSAVELTDTANEVLEEELQDVNITEAALISEMLPSDPLTVELADAENEVVEEELQDMNINEAAPINEMLASNPLTVKLADTENDVVEEELQDMNINEGTLINELLLSDQLRVEPNLYEASQFQSVDVKVKTTMEDSSTKAEDQSMEDDLQQVSFSNIEENDVVDVIPMSHIEETEPIVEEEVSQPQSTPFELNPTMQVSDVELEEIRVQNPDDGMVQVNAESEDLSISVKLERTQVSLTEVMDVTQPYAEDELQKVETEDASEHSMEDLLPPMIVEEESSQPQPNSLALEPAKQVSDTELEETICQNLDDGILQVTNESEDPSVSMQVSHIEVMDVNAEEELEKGETEDISEGDTENLLAPATMHTSEVELTGSANEGMEEGLQDMNISEDTLIDDMAQSDSLGAEPTLDEVSSSDIKLESNSDVSNTEGMNVKDLDFEEELQPVSIDSMAEDDAVDVMPSELILEEVEITPTIQVSDIEVQDAASRNLDDEILQVIDEVASDSFIKDARHSSHQLEAQLVQDEVLHQNIVEECAETDALGSSILLAVSEHDPLLEEDRTEDYVSSSELAEASEDMDLLLTAEAEIEREDIYLTGDFLSSGAALLEHPDKALTGGDDAYFVAGSRWLGVANGVSQWSFEGTDPGVYAQELMRTCEEIVLDTSSLPVTNPVELLCRGVKETSMLGSSNVLIANFDGQFLHVANIGDTGFLIIRHGSIYKKSSPLLHEFHFALQVEDSDDPLQLVEEHTIELEEGDIIVSATDGLFDNLYEREIALIVSKSLQVGIKPQEIANALATRAQEVGRSSYVRSPFSDAAQAAGYTGYAGGKPDNVAVIVALVQKTSNFVAE